MTAPLVDALKSETFWVGVQSISALAGIIYLVQYTGYTKRMMELQLEARRAEVAPVFTLSSLGGSASAPMTSESISSPPRNIHLTVRNIGKGPALRVSGWHGSVVDTFRLEESQMLKRRLDDEDGVSTNSEILVNESAEMMFQSTETSSHWLCVLECEDTGGQKHQFQLIRIPQSAATDPWLMIHGWSASPPGR